MCDVCAGLVEHGNRNVLRQATWVVVVAATVIGRRTVIAVRYEYRTLRGNTLKRRTIFLQNIFFVVPKKQAD